MSSGSGYLLLEPEPPRNCRFWNQNCLRRFRFRFLKSRNRLKRFRFQFLFLRNRCPLDTRRFRFQYRGTDCKRNSFLGYMIFILKKPPSSILVNLLSPLSSLCSIQDSIGNSRSDSQGHFPRLPQFEFVSCNPPSICSPCSIDSMVFLDSCSCRRSPQLQVFIFKSSSKGLIEGSSVITQKTADAGEGGEGETSILHRRSPTKSRFVIHLFGYQVYLKWITSSYMN
ncbi:unnamed protein product [Lactuca saligna]|uniref:Uncharacterized protein n=1 Tax=Lactuca saligna TaxID=75948 RepID=A0AA35YKI8_LACSI|nr:unnamed protein product [Lactuca saligna]